MALASQARSAASSAPVSREALAAWSAQLDDYCARLGRESVEEFGSRGVVVMTLHHRHADSRKIGTSAEFYMDDALATRFPQLVRLVAQYEPAREAVVVYVTEAGDVLRTKLHRLATWH